MTLPPAFRDPAILAYLAQVVSWREGDPIPPMPNGLTTDDLPDLFLQLNNPAVSKAVAYELSTLVPHPNRKRERR